MTRKKIKKAFTPEQKAEALRRHLLDKVEMSVLCQEFGIAPSLFYRWRNQLFENGALALQDRRRGDPQKQKLEAERRQREKLQAQLDRKNHVIAILAERNMRLEKEDGGH